MADREDIAYLSDIHGETGNLAEFGEDGALRDSHKKVSDFVGISDVQTVVQDQVSTATSEIWNAVNGVYAFVAYKSPAWTASTSYTAGSSFCMYNGAGYECTETHTSGSTFDSSKWRLVLTAAGKQAIDTLLAGYSAEGKAALTNLAPPFDGNADYVVGQMCVKTISGSPVLVVCTSAGRGDGARFSQDVTIESNIVARLAALSADLQGRIPTATSQLTNNSGYITQADVPTNVSAFTNDADYVAATVVDAEYNTSEHGYVEGDTCTHGGKFYICVQDVPQGAPWDDESGDWREATLKEVVSGWSIAAHPDWNEEDPTSPAYIRNKPNIEYKVVELVSVPNASSTNLTFQLQDRAVNVIEAEISDTRNITLLLPAKAGSSISRDFYVVFAIDSERNVPVEVAQASLVDCAGEQASVFSLADEKRVTYKFTETSDDSRIFMVSGYDIVHQKMQEIEAALDYLISGGDPGGGEIVSNVYIPDEDNLYHKLTATTDEDGNVNISVENEGVPKGDFAPSVSIPDEGGLYHKLVAVKDPETGEVNIGVVQEGEEI